MPALHAMAENHFQTHDGVSLFYRHRPAQGRRRGAVVMFHRGHEHSGRLAHLIDELDLPDAMHAQLWPHRHGTDAMYIQLLAKA